MDSDVNLHDINASEKKTPRGECNRIHSVNKGFRENNNKKPMIQSQLHIHLIYLSEFLFKCILHVHADIFFDLTNKF